MGKAHGQGIETNPDGSTRHEGLWRYDDPINADGTVIEDDSDDGDGNFSV